MKTTRTNCFETNSSSTHALSVHAPMTMAKPSMVFLPDEDGERKISLDSGTDPDDSPHGRLTFLLAFTRTIGDKPGWDRVVKTVEDFAKLKIVATKHGSFDREKREWGVETVTDDNFPETVPILDESGDYTDDIKGVVADDFYYWTTEYGNGSVSSFLEEARKCYVDQQSILTFVFTSCGGFSTETYYNG